MIIVVLGCSGYNDVSTISVAAKGVMTSNHSPRILHGSNAFKHHLALSFSYSFSLCPRLLCFGVILFLGDLRGFFYTCLSVNHSLCVCVLLCRVALLVILSLCVFLYLLSSLSVFLFLSDSFFFSLCLSLSQ